MREKCLPHAGNRTHPARWHVLVAVVAIAAFAPACAHTDEKDQVAREAERREVDLLRERVARLERQSSDTHAKLDRVIAKLDDREAAVGDRAPARETPVERQPVSEPVPPDAMAIASRSIDISRASVDDDEMSSVDDSREEPREESREESRSADDGAPIVIDADALRRFDARETGSSPAASRSPSNRARRAAARESPPSQTESPRHARVPRGDRAPALEGGTMTQSKTLPAKPNAVDVSGNPKLVYKRAMQHVDDGRCDLAEQGFSAILTRAPDHDLADNALYWTGVCRQRAGRLEDARQLFADVPLRYPGSNKIADALFSLAEVHEAQGDPATARTYYTELVTRFPTVDRAKDAEQALLRLGKR